MDLQLPLEVASTYKSPSQRARVLTEAWAAENIYCPACSSDRLLPTAHNTEAVDFRCPACKAAYQLKATKNPIRSRVVDAGYDAMMRALRRGVLPHFLVLRYNPTSVADLLIVPNFAIPPSAIEKRRPLSNTARRAGWVGCNIVLDRIPVEGRVIIVRDGSAVLPHDVRYSFGMLRFLDKVRPIARGWTLDVLNGLRSFQLKAFSIKDAYSLEPMLRKLHPMNRHIRPKIRQQLQFLRDMGYLKFIKRGQYEWLSAR